MPRAKGATNVVSIHIALWFSSASKCFKRNLNLKQKYHSELFILVALLELEIWFWFLVSSNQDSWQSSRNALYSWNRVPFIGMRCISFLFHKIYVRWCCRTVLASSVPSAAVHFEHNSSHLRSEVKEEFSYSALTFCVWEHRREHREPREREWGLGRG